MTSNKHPLQELFYYAGYDPRAYSGRAMYGRDCLAVTVTGSNYLGHLIACVIGVMFDSTWGHTYADIEAVKSAFKKMRTDNLGNDMIVYFPGVQFVSED